MAVRSQHQPRVGEIFVQKGLLTAEQLATLAVERDASDATRIGSLAVARGLVPRVELLKVLSERHGVPGIDLSQVVIPLMHLRFIKRDIARQHALLSIFVKEDQLVVVMADPTDGRTTAELEYITGRTVFAYVAGHSELLRTIDAAYDARQAGEAFHIGPNAPDEYLESLGLSRDSSQVNAVPAPASPSVGRNSVVVMDDPPKTNIIPTMGSVGMANAPTADVGRDTPLYAGLPPMADEKSGESQTTILVVDDDSDIRRMMVTCLRDSGFNVIDAADGATGLASAKANLPSLVVLDAMMPGLHGLDVCRGLKESPETAKIPVLLVSAVYTGWRAEADLRSSYDVDGYMEKPFSLQAFTQKVDQLLEGRTSSLDSERISLSPEAVEALHSGIEFYRQGRTEEALASLKGGLDHDADCFQLHLQLGLLYGRQERLFDAMQSLETAVDLNRHDFSALRNLAILYQKAGFRHKAIEAWERALVISPDEETRAGIKEHLVSLL